MLVRLALASVCLSGVLAKAAWGGAWNPERKAIHLITATHMTFASSVFDNDGNMKPAPSFRRLEATLYMEYGITDQWAAIGQLGYEQADVRWPVASSYQGLGYTELGLRRQVWKGRKAVVSAQSSVRVAGASDAGNPVEAGHTETEWDIRALAGYGFTLRRWTGFIDIQGGYRFRFGNPADEARLDASMGVHIHRRLMVMAQSFNTLSVQDARNGYLPLREHKLQVSTVWTVFPRTFLQVGTRNTFAGRNTWAEQTWFGGVWTTF
jgi:protein XagA